jgi:hypothetical protein
MTFDHPLLLSHSSMRFLLLAPVLWFAAPRPNAVQTAKWKEIGKTMMGNPVLLDPRSVKKDSAGIVTATLRVTFVKPVATPKGPITSSRTIAMFDCKKHIVAVKDNTYFHDEKANRVYQHSAPKIPGFAAPFQGTLPDVAMAYFCAK